MKDHIINLEVGRIGNPIKVPVVQSDSGRKLCCRITDMVLKDTYKARIYAVKPAKKEIYNDCTIDGNAVVVELDDQILAEVGHVGCQIKITNEEGKKVSSFEFTLDVKKDLMSESAIESSNEFTALDNALKDAKNAAYEATSQYLEEHGVAGEAKAGQFISVKEVDENGKIIEIEAVDPPEGSGNGINEETDPTVPDWAKQPQKPTYTAEEVGARSNTWMPSASEVGADERGTADTKVSTHNAEKNSHNDIRLLIQNVQNALEAFLDIDDESMNQATEFVAYMKDNRELIEQITTSKVNVSDIVDDYATNVSNKPVSAAVAVKLKALIDAIIVPTKTSQLTNDSGFLTKHQDLSGYAKKAKTLSGYGITDGATKEEVNNLSQEIVDHKTEVDDELDGMKVTIVQEVLAQLGGDSNSVFGKVNEDGTITITTDLETGDYTLMYENEDGSLTEVGTITVGEVAVYYSIARTLTACTSNKSATNIEEGTSWTETITANDGFELSNVTVTMGGVNVTSSVYSNGVITILEVTGDIVITATATEIVGDEVITGVNVFDKTADGFLDNQRISSSATTTGYITSATDRFITNYIRIDNGMYATIDVPGNKTTVSITVPYYLCYDENKNLLGIPITPTGSVSNHKLKIKVEKTNVAYIRICPYKNDQSACFIISCGYSCDCT